MEKVDKKTQKKKIKKYKRDFDDFKKGEICLWQNGANDSLVSHPLPPGLPPRGTNTQGIVRLSPGQCQDSIPQGTLKQPFKNQRGRGINRPTQRGRNQGHPGLDHIPHDAQRNGNYMVNTHNRFDPLSTQGNKDNMNNVPSPCPAPFLGRGMRGTSRGR